MDRKDEVFAEAMAIIYVVVWGVIQYLLSRVTYTSNTVEFLNGMSWLFLAAAVIIGLFITIRKILIKKSHKRRA